MHRIRITSPETERASTRRIRVKYRTRQVIRIYGETRLWEGTAIKPEYEDVLRSSLARIGWLVSRDKRWRARIKEGKNLGRNVMSRKWRQKDATNSTSKYPNRYLWNSYFFFFFFRTISLFVSLECIREKNCSYNIHYILHLKVITFEYRNIVKD